MLMPFPMHAQMLEYQYSRFIIIIIIKWLPTFISGGIVHDPEILDCGSSRIGSWHELED